MISEAVSDDLTAFLAPTILGYAIWHGSCARPRPHPRHSLGRRQLERGADLAEVQRVLGHRRISSTRIYLTPREDDVSDAIERASV